MLSRGTKILLLLAVALVIVGCPRHRKVEPVPALYPPPMPMDVDEVVNFEFPADGHWHYSGVLVLYHDQILMEPVGLADGLKLGAIECRVDMNRPIYVDPDTSVRFENFGPLFFRCNSIEARYFPKPITIRITKRDARH